MSTDVSLASAKSEVFEALLGFLPDWVQITVLALVVLAVVATWVVKLRRKLAHRRALRGGQPVHAAAQYGQGRGADHLGAYAPRQRAQQGSGADHLGPYAPRQQSGADFLGSYAPGQQRNGSA
ncbi:hypothetical protein GCM10010377_63090 [Streptomyces viridiviolaceus]|uniref:Integral membrane protein n=1 Tax=Streptomyces viridiviolaceus TaxID=68282 RepID=A0ABW2E542_9ACTN|nr:hypothetical protein [Streptomyces viridiviolaceus]GHB63440.1 hypothetical protein GCM10010377_63090 [Streptomyces viridiviolaceus]